MLALTLCEPAVVAQPSTTLKNKSYTCIQPNLIAEETRSQTLNRGPEPVNRSPIPRPFRQSFPTEVLTMLARNVLSICWAAKCQPRQAGYLRHDCRCENLSAAKAFPEHQILNATTCDDSREAAVAQF